MSPRRRFTLRIEPGRALLYDRRTHQYHRRTAAETFLLVASREVSVGEAVARLADEIGSAAAGEALRSLARDGALSTRRPFRGRIVELPEVPGAWSAPLVAHLGVTLACNFSCAHCYSSSGKRAPGELSLEELRALVDQLSEAGCQKLVLGGGEPFLRDDLPALVRHADRRGVDCFVHTNASLVRPALLAALARCPPAGLAVSLDGADARANDRVRGPGAFRRALRGMAALRRHYPPGFNLSVTITPANAGEAAGLVELAHREGAGVLLLRPAYPSGEALRAPGLVCDRQSFAAAIDRARSRARELGVTADAPHPDEQGVPDFEGFGCVAARVVLGITPTGDVTPCLNLPGAFLAGNVRQLPVLELWRRGRPFHLVREQRPNAQCESCAHYDACRGGCRVRALFSGNGLGGPDGWCHYEPFAELDPAG